MDDSQKITGYAGDVFIADGIEFGPAATGGGAVTNKTSEWITCGEGISIQVLEEYIDGVSTNVLTEHNLTAGQALPTGYILRSARGAGFSRLKISGGNANGFVIAPERTRNFQDSPYSGIYKNG